MIKKFVESKNKNKGGKMERKKTIKKFQNRFLTYQKPKKLFKTFAIIAWLLAAGAILTLGGNVVVKDGGLNVTDDFFVSTDVLFVDTTNSKVGIGTTTPGQKLEVVGNINTTGTIYAHNFSGSSPIVFLNSSGEESVRIEDNGSITATSFVGDGSLLTGITEIPSGVIVMWAGTYNNIPSGWHLCDGTSGTPDLRNRFIYGVNTSYGAGNDGDLNTTGGSSTHSHDYSDLPAHTHNITDPGHTHSVAQYGVASGGGRVLMDGVNLDGYLTATNSVTSITINSAGVASPTTDVASTLPPYYKLAYIMKT